MREALSPPFFGDNGGGKTSTPTPSSSVAAATATASTDSLNGLKFGKKIYFEDVGSGVPAKQGTLPVIEPFPAPASSSQGKKGKGSVQSNQPPRCQVDGCKVDLSGAKPYYSRHKVCAHHSKSPKVMVAGREQRFCQQCSRFHEPSAFDQGKRSCRRRLAGHNERRRKPPLGSLLSRYGRLPLSLHGSDFIKENNRTGSLLMDFTHPRLPGRDIWPIIQVGDRTPIGEVTASAGRFLSHPWQDDLDAPSSESFSLTSHPYLQNSASGSVFSGSEISPACCFSRVSDSGCALSLLSPQPWMPRNRGSGLTVNNLLNDEGVPMAQSTNPSSTSSDKFLTMGSQWPSSFAGVIPEQFPAARSKASGNFRSYETSSSQQEIQREMGFRQLMPEPFNNQFPNDLELAQQGSRQSMEFAHLRGYGSSSQQMHWPL